MIEITNRFRVTVTVKKDEPAENMDILRKFESYVYAISSDEKKFLVYDAGDTEHKSGFKWINIASAELTN